VKSARNSLCPTLGRRFAPLLLSLIAFETAASTITVARVGSGAGAGTVTASTGTIACGISCSDTFVDGAMLTLTAAPGNGSQFTGWLGPCTGSGLSCSFQVSGDATVTATFAAPPIAGRRLDADGSGDCDALTDGLLLARHLLGVTGPGLVTGGLGATAARTQGADVDAFLAAAHPALDLDGDGQVDATTDGVLALRYLLGLRGDSLTAGALGSGWTRDAAAIATYANNLCAPLPTFALTVQKAGDGTGTVSATSGIDCGATCQAEYQSNSGVTLTATPMQGSTFGGWSGGDCTGVQPTCTMTMNAARSVTATFTLMQFTLTVTKSGDGSGAISGNGLSCGATCSVPLSYGTPVSLAATPDSVNATLSSFTAWSGAGCSGTGACMFTITADTTVNAAFRLKPNLMFTSSALFDGNLGGLAGADAKCQTLAQAKGLTGNYRAYLGATATNAPSRFAVASGWTRVDGSPLVDSIGDFGTVALQNPPALDESGNDLSQSAQTRVWTATNADTTYFGQNCNNTGIAPDWSTTSGRTLTGILSATNVDVLTGGSVFPCGTPVHLYCFGIDRSASLP
jgi:hypothetical protein